MTCWRKACKGTGGSFVGVHVILQCFGIETLVVGTIHPTRGIWDLRGLRSFMYVCTRLHTRSSHQTCHIGTSLPPSSGVDSSLGLRSSSRLYDDDITALLALSSLVSQQPAGNLEIAWARWCAPHGDRGCMRIGGYLKGSYPLICQDIRIAGSCDLIVKIKASQ